MRQFLVNTAAILLASQAFALGKSGKTTSSSESPKEECPPAHVCFQGEPLGECCLPASYSAPATIAVTGNQFCGCSSYQLAFFADASFLYWLGGEDGLSLAANGEINGSTMFFATKTSNHYQNFSYRPGFKVGFGSVQNRDWTLRAEYTWLRGQNVRSLANSSNTAIAGSTTLTGHPVLFVNDWFLMGTTNGQALAADGISSKWSYGVDLADLLVSRPFYQGRSVIITPFLGLRGAWIRQKMHVRLSESVLMFSGSALPASRPSQPIESRNYSNSWAVGPRFGMDAELLMPLGFRFEGDLAASLLYTRYTKVAHSEDRASTAFNPGPYTALLRNYGCLRPMAECGLGFGWGRYINCQDYHIDFAATYDFTYMWAQNMIRKLLDDVLTGTDASSGDLYFHGLTLMGRFDF